MGFQASIKSAFSKYAVFSGRALRSEFWFFYLFLFLGSLAARGLDAAFGIHTPPIKGDPVLSWSAFSLIFRIAVILPLAALAARRLHDIGRSGWWLGGLPLIIVLGVLTLTQTKSEAALFAWLAAWGVWVVGLVICFCMAGMPGPNRYGPPPARVTAPE